MNTNPSAKRILVFGDSNTWGRVPGDDNAQRYPVNKRWTGILQTNLGIEYEIIEEGLNGRTTNYESPHKNGKNGNLYLLSCLESHNPIDIVVLALGKNDLKEKYELSAEDIVDGLEKCINTVKEEGTTFEGGFPRVLIIPPLIIEEKLRTRGGKNIVDFKGGKAKSIALQTLYKILSQEEGCEFLDVNKHVKVSEIDGVHMDEQAHTIYAKLVAERLQVFLYNSDY